MKPETLELTRGHTATGEICLCYPGGHFPEEEWNDFPVVVLQWWIENMQPLLAGAGEARLRFMDGPFEIVVVRRRDLLAIHGRRAGDPPDFHIEVRPPDFARSLDTAAQAILDACEHRGWQTADVESLRASVVRHRRTMARLLS